MLKNEIPSHFFRDLWAIAAYELAIAGYVLFREPSSRNYIRSAAQLYKSMREKRKLIHARRRVEWREIQQWFR
jgi:hypothetical protein